MITGSGRGQAKPISQTLPQRLIWGPHASRASMGVYLPDLFVRSRTQSSRVSARRAPCPNMRDDAASDAPAGRRTEVHRSRSSTGTSSFSEAADSCFRPRMPRMVFAVKDNQC